MYCPEDFQKAGVGAFPLSAGIDGFEVAQRLRAMPALAGAFLVAMSGYGSPEDVAHARAAGFDEYLVKPADLDLLRAWLRSRA